MAQAPEPTTAAQPPWWVCLVKGCRIEGVRQPVLDGEVYYPPEHRLSHYWREHYVETEAEYTARRAEAVRRSREHYRLTGEMIPPDV